MVGRFVVGWIVLFFSFSMDVWWMAMYYLFPFRNALISSLPVPRLAPHFALLGKGYPFVPHQRSTHEIITLFLERPFSFALASGIFILPGLDDFRLH